MSLGATLCGIVLNCCYSAAFTNLPITRPTIIQQQRWTQEKISSPLHESRRSGNHDRVITASSSGDHPHYHSFDEMKSMESRLDHLQRKAPELLCGFYEKHLKSFSVTPGSATVSIFHIMLLISFTIMCGILNFLDCFTMSAEHIRNIHMLCPPSHLLHARLFDILFRG